jgi:hypothetical protein
VKEHGGVMIAQDESTSQRFEMPRSAIESGAVDYVLPLDDIAPALVRLVTARSRRSIRRWKLAELLGWHSDCLVSEELPICRHCPGRRHAVRSELLRDHEPADGL